MTPVSFDLCMGAVEKSGRVLYAFTEFYLYFHGIEPSFLFQQFGVFGCISAAVYCVDESVEQKPGEKRGIGVDDLEQLLVKRIEFTEHVSCLLEDARAYCAFEVAAREGMADYDLAQVLQITQIRSVDFRLMHHALLQLAGIPYDPEVFEWFRAFEMLMEIEDDLSSIEEDGQSGGFNHYCFAKNLAGADVEEAVESVRLHLESQLKCIGDSLRKRGFARCEHVIDRYRAIVPRRRVPE